MTAGRTIQLDPEDRRPPRQEDRPAPRRRRRRSITLFLLRWSIVLAIWAVLMAGGALLFFAWVLPRRD